MKIFKNTSLQGFSVPFSTPQGIKTAFIGAKQSFEAPDSWSSTIATNLVKRRMFKITTIASPTPVVEVVDTSAAKKKKTTPRENS